MVNSKKMETPKLSIIIPGYNEQRNLKRGVLKQVADYLQGVEYDCEVLIVDDGSTDSSREIIKEQIKNFKNWRLILNPHQGKALTVMTGLLEAKGEIALFTDMDQATPLSEVEKMLSKFAEGFDIVIGARAGRQGAPMLRKLAAWVFATLRNAVLGLPFADTQCGFKAFNSRSRQAIFPKMFKDWQGSQTRGHTVNAGFDIELLFRAKKLGFKIAAVTVEWRHFEGTKEYGLVRNSLDAIKDMLKIRWNDLMGKYG